MSIPVFFTLSKGNAVVFGGSTYSSKGSICLNGWVWNAYKNWVHWVRDLIEMKKHVRETWKKKKSYTRCFLELNASESERNRVIGHRPSLPNLNKTKWDNDKIKQKERVCKWKWKWKWKGSYLRTISIRRSFIKNMMFFVSRKLNAIRTKNE
jgi:hypothetical protein